MKPTLHIVEDDPAVRHSLRMVLELFGYPVEEYADGEALLARGSMANSCVILDTHLPGADGLEVLARLRARQTGVPVVLVSGLATERMRRRAAHLAPLAFLEKPLDIDVLLHMIASLDP